MGKQNIQAREVYNLREWMTSADLETGEFGLNSTTQVFFSAF